MRLRNIGVYKDGKFDFTADPQRPIVLYGGANGAGKTTLFESIKLCLYGQWFSDDKTSKKKYHEKIHKLFHKSAETRTAAGEAYIILEFQYFQNGSVDQYMLIRTWQNNDGRIDESLEIKKKPANAKTEYSAIDSSGPHLQMLINQMIPRDIAGMFFFDGEKIQDIVQSGNEDAHIRSAFDALLGLDIPDRLSDDVGLYLLRNSDTEADAAVLADLERKTNEKETIEKKISNLHEKCIFLKAEISRHGKELEQKEKKFFNMGGDFAKDRQELLTKKMDLDKEIMSIEDMLCVLVEKNLPLAIVPEQLRQVKAELDSDMAKIRANFEKETLAPAFASLKDSFEKKISKYGQEMKKEMLGILDNTMDAKMESLPKTRPPTFDFSLAEMRALQDRIDSVLNDRHADVLEKRKAHKQYLEEQKEASAKLTVVPQHDEVGPLYSEIKHLTRHMGEMEQELQTMENLKAREKSLLILLNSKIRNCLARKKSNVSQQRGLELIPKIQGALEEYSNRLREKKISLLESNIQNGIGKCFHKDSLISKITIDPNTYNVTMYQKNGEEITKDQLAAGELQMYATAIVWGLAKTSGRALPFVIDTPLARLDDKHRENLIRNFYPTASHQTIIFSTNTEIIDSYFEMLKPYISHARLIQYDADRDGSIVDDGYFGNGGRIIAS